MNGLTAAMSAQVTHIHIMLQSIGGFVGDGIFLYNLLRSVPMEVTVYNVGQISSAGVLVYLGAANRVASKRSTFMLHRTSNSPQFANASKLQNVAKSLLLDDERTDAIIKEHVTFPSEILEELKYHDVYISGEEAVRFGMATTIGEFPTPNSQIYNILI